MDFTPFDTEKIDEYAKRAREKWQHTDAYREFEEKSRGRSAESEREIAGGMMAIFADLGKIRDGSPDSAEAQALVKRLQEYITEHYYRCTPELLRSLGMMYGADGEFTENIDRAGGKGTAEFAAQAIRIYCR